MNILNGGMKILFTINTNKMKYLIILLLITSTAGAQCVEPDRYFTGGLHYLTNQKAQGFQLEIGSTGAESNFSYYATITGFKQKNTGERELVKFTYPKMGYGLKFAWRLYHAESVLNIYATTLIEDDIATGVYNANSLKILTVLGGKVALSLEPSYLIRQKAFLAQAGINIILD